MAAASESILSRTKGTITFEPVKDGTLATSTNEVIIKGLRRFFTSPAFEARSKEAATKNLASFAEYVEGLEAASPTA